MPQSKKTDCKKSAPLSPDCGLLSTGERQGGSSWCVVGYSRVVCVGRSSACAGVAIAASVIAPAHVPSALGRHQSAAQVNDIARRNAGAQETPGDSVPFTFASFGAKET
jgi:hypothetical protein